VDLPLNIGFATPKTDTCKKCKATSTKLKCMSSDSCEYKGLNEEWTKHKEQAQKAFELLRNDAEFAKENRNTAAYHSYCSKLSQPQN